MRTGRRMVRCAIRACGPHMALGPLGRWKRPLLLIAIILAIGNNHGRFIPWQSYFLFPLPPGSRCPDGLFRILTKSRPRLEGYNKMGSSNLGLCAVRMRVLPRITFAPIPTAMASSFTVEAFSLLGVGVTAISIRTYARCSTVGFSGLKPDDFLMLGAAVSTLLSTLSSNLRSLPILVDANSSLRSI
jgi:hypothetical protein